MSRSLKELEKQLTRIPAGKYLVGLSGGADSVALLMMLKDLSAEWMLELEAVHVNHGLREHAADLDEAFCRNLCGQAQIPLHVSSVQLYGRRDENTARNARLDCFRGWISETGAKGIILAHQQTDAAETFLMHLIRGAGPDGLGGMRPFSELRGIPLIRPMLRIGRETIRDALRADGISWREDESNTDEGYLRNAVRRKLLPEMEKLTSGAAAHIAAAADMLAEDREWSEAQAQSFLDKHQEKGWIRAADLLALPEVLRKRVLRLWWLRDGPELEERQLNAAQTGALADLLKLPRGRLNLPGEYHAVRTGRNLHLVSGCRKQETEAVWIPPETGTEDGRFTLLQTASEGNPGDGIRVQEVPEGWLEGCVIRNRKPGDRIRPFGSGHTKKLQDYLVDRGVDEPWRDQIPLICRDNEVLWAGGIGAGAVPTWDPAKTMVRLTWLGSMPWAEQGEEKENGKNS